MFTFDSTKLETMKIKQKHRFMYNIILVHVARTWERIRLEQKHQEMPQDNIESSEDAIPTITDEIFGNVVIQGFLKASEKVKEDDYWEKNTGTMSDWYIESEATNIIYRDYLKASDKTR